MAAPRPRLGRDGALDPGAGVGDRRFDLGQVIDAQELELRLQGAGEISAHLQQRVIQHRAGAQVEVIVTVCESLR